MDTPLVNGAAYPFVQVGMKTYRFRIFNVCNDRSLNLQLYFAKSNNTMWDLNTGRPSTWPTDGRDGGVPDPNAVGPSMIQIGNEGGFLPAVTILPNTPVGYNYNRIKRYQQDSFFGACRTGGCHCGLFPSPRRFQIDSI